MDNNKTSVQIGFIFQTILAVFILFSAFYSVAYEEFSIVTQILLSLFFIVLAYNNHVTFKRKNFTIIYLVVAILILLVMVF